MSRRRRPTAYEVSFGEEDPQQSIPAEDLSSRLASSSIATGERHARSFSSLGRSGLKRKEYELSSLSGKAPKRSRLDVRTAPKIRYQKDPNDIVECKDMIIRGETSDNRALDSEDVPVRMLSDFCIFDSRDYQLLSLNLLDDEGSTHKLAAAGCVEPVFADEEDAGQEDDLQVPSLRLRTTEIFRFAIDYAKMDDSPVYIQTQYGWYILKAPSSPYRLQFENFYRPHRVTQVFISAARENPEWTAENFYSTYDGMWDRFLQCRLRKRDFEATMPFIRNILKDLYELDVSVAPTTLVEWVRNSRTPSLLPSRTPGPHAPCNLRHPTLARYSPSKNLDLAVLRTENQIRTHVTPLIDRLALGLFQEHLQVVGAKEPNSRNMQQIEKQDRIWLLRLVGKWLDALSGNRNPRIQFPPNEQLRDEFWRSVVIDGCTYAVGDVVLIPAGNDPERRREAPTPPTNLRDISDTATVSDYFWFGKIIFIDQRRKKVHCQWMEHASKTMLEEIGDPQELFLCGTCTKPNVDLHDILDKATVCWNSRRNNNLAPSEFYCSFFYDEPNALYRDLDDPNSIAALASEPPENCPVCLLSEQREHERVGQLIEDGVAYGGLNYHVHDFALLRAENDVDSADIVQILDVRFSTRARSAHLAVMSVRMLGRIGDIMHICPHGIIKDEQHLFLTDEEIHDVPVTRLVNRCYVLHPDSARSPGIDEWLSLSPSHMYARFHFPTRTPSNWSERKRLKYWDVFICPKCIKDDNEQVANLRQFLSPSNQLKAFDPFGGVGAFGLGMEESGCVKMVHAVEISPSAARTLQNNSPNYAIKTHAGHQVEAPETISRRGQLPDPPKPGQIDCIVAGFPCQPHSRLNMFQRANDRKSHLILNLLSWIDFLRPKYCFLENVRGFLSYSLNATQAGRYRVEGGIAMGGLKFVIHALLAMNYQVRMGLLQAAHYGTPQTRVRFFLIAARHSYLLPSMPQPTHSFPVKDALALKLTNGGMALPVLTGSGLAPFKYISIDDAISDLPREIPKAFLAAGIGGVVRIYLNSPIVVMNQSLYKKCREKGTRDLQHFTRVLPDKVIQRVVEIPLEARADYTRLREELWEWQFSNPTSAVARDGFRAGLYGRLDKNEWFQTTVTNVEPTAKQSRVLNPYCKRVVTVRELARSQGFPDHFVFYAENSDVKTMHRQIGNAVPWPVGAALGRELRDAALTKWLTDRQEATVID
ncbi:uncharacterized protein FIBRA_06785 [Fibroporia radiculosa]|uniref:DNA (cytosine-5-)-methyltransferase n=1 Tax=Fibroporia radiculosa TaxID=599839 RepID=J4GCH9_9APHY|nr:uncharacterized protein FIBRA_06785 [Fibroporia radiculosa]CCM04603.1 predicted protein [Fibroporia radiculosa]